MPFCPACGTELSSETSACPKCAAPVANKTRQWIVGGLVLLLASLMGLPFALRETSRQYATMSGEGTGYLIGSFFGPWIFSSIIVTLYFYFRKKKAAHSYKFQMFAIWVLGFTVVNAAGSMGRATPPDTRASIESEIGQILSEAAAGKPATASSSPWAPVVREIFNDLLAWNSEYVKELEAAGGTELPDLYQPHSFTQRQTGQRVLQHLQNLRAVNRKYAAFEPIEQRMRERVMQMSPSDKDRESFLRGMTASMRKSLAPRERGFQTELLWLDAAIDLYTLAVENQPAFRLRQGEMIISDDSLREAFNTKLEQTQRLHQQYLSAVEAFEQQRADNLKKLGLKPGDVQR